MKNKEEINNNEFRNFILNPNRILKGTKMKILKEEGKKGKSMFDLVDPYYAILERDLIISENYKPIFEMKIIEGKEELELDSIPNPYINFIFKTGSAEFTYDTILCVNQIKGNIYEVRTEIHDFLIEILEFYIEEGSKLKIFEYKEDYVLFFNAILNNNIDSSMKNKEFNFTRQKDENWDRSLVVLNSNVDSIKLTSKEENDYQIKVKDILYFVEVL